VLPSQNRRPGMIGPTPTASAPMTSMDRMPAPKLAAGPKDTPGSEITPQFLGRHTFPAETLRFFLGDLRADIAHSYLIPLGEVPTELLKSISPKQSLNVAVKAAAKGQPLSPTTTPAIPPDSLAFTVGPSESSAGEMTNLTAVRSLSRRFGDPYFRPSEGSAPAAVSSPCYDARDAE